jgi:hypothetical protein
MRHMIPWLPDFAGFASAYLNIRYIGEYVSQRTFPVIWLYRDLSDRFASR